VEKFFAILAGQNTSEVEGYSLKYKWGEGLAVENLGRRSQYYNLSNIRMA
jgi:hypothetical protein